MAAMKRTWLIVFCCTLLATLAAGVVVWWRMQPQPQTVEMPDEHTTDKVDYFHGSAPFADPLVVGRWQNTENPQWYKVYYDDSAEDDWYWGKEWEENENVYEEDLSFHGNGWFRWKKQGNTLYGISTMDMRDVPIVNTYRIRKNNQHTLSFENQQLEIVFCFTRIGDW